MDVMEPCPVRALLGLRMSQAAGGGSHTLALSGGLCVCACPAADLVSWF